ncbi:MAG TPA: ABC transporter permease [Bacteroidales bacterium]|nr:ABC transporter permease [Bacteroidales bacterium]
MKILKLLRSQARNKMILATNIIGLSVGLAATILLVIFILHESSYDRYFKNADRIVRLNSIWTEDGNKSVEPINLRTAYTDIPRTVPGIENAVQIYRGGQVELSYNQSRFNGNRLLYADSTFFTIFDFKPVEGNLMHSLDDPNSIVLTKKTARKIFGNEPATGKPLMMGDRTFFVSAVMEDVPANTHFTFDILMPMKAVSYLNDLSGLEFFTYYLINPNADQKATSLMICQENTKMLKDGFESFNADFSSETEPLKSLHLHTDASMDLTRSGSVQTIILVGIIAFMVLFMALTNFVNLFVIEGENRAKEIGVRKVNGADRGKLFRQFFSEAAIIVTIAFFIAFVLAVFFLPEFGKLMQRQFPVNLLKKPIFILSLPLVFLLTVFLSGSYPGFYLSRMQPVSVLKSRTSKAGRKKYVMNIAGGLQLFITLVLFTVLFGINKEINYLKNLSPGFNPGGLVNIFNLNDKMKSQYPSIKDKLMSIPEVAGVAASSHTIGGGTSGQGIRLLESPKEQMVGINEYRIHAGLCKLLQVKLKEGRFFDPERPADKNGVILNEAAMKKLGLTTAVGRKVVMFDQPMDVIGVVKDFRYESAAKAVQPLVLTDYSNAIRTIMVRLTPNVNRAVAMNKIGMVLKSFDPGYVMNTRLTSDIYRQYYADDDRIGQLTAMGAILSLIILMMGIFQLVSQNLAKRTKEIGIRKVLGGSTPGILVLLYSNSVIWTLVASMAAIPVSYFYLHGWLQNFMAKTSLNLWVFISGLVIVLAVEILITIGHTWRETRKNPVDALRYE